MVKKIDSLAVMDRFYEKGIKPGDWCRQLRVVYRSFHLIINNEIGLKRPGMVTRRVRRALERDGLMVYLDENSDQQAA